MEVIDRVRRRGLASFTKGKAMNEVSMRVGRQVVRSSSHYETIELSDEDPADKVRSRERKNLRLPPRLFATPSTASNPLVPLLPDIRTTEQAVDALRWRGVPRPGDPNNIDIGDAVEAYAAFPSAYLATVETGHLYHQLLTTIRYSLTYRNPCEIRYARFYWDQGDVMAGKPFPAMPDFLQSLVGLGVKLIGVSGGGRSAFLQRLRIALGPPRFMQRLSGDGPVTMRYLPMLIVSWPDSGTVSGLLENFNHTLMGELASSETQSDNFSYFRGRNGPATVIAACIFLNLGILVIDGCCAKSLGGEAGAIMDFIATFQRRSGIPVLISGTYIFELALLRRGSRSAKFSTCHAQYFDPIPEHLAEKSTNARRGPVSLLERVVAWHWSLGHLEMNLPCPNFLPSVMWDHSFGRMQLICEGFNELHHQILWQPGLFASGQLQEVEVRKILSLWRSGRHST